MLDKVNSCQIQMNVQASVSKTNPGMAPVTRTETTQYKLNFTKGTGPDQINEVVFLYQTVAAAGNVVLDLSGSLTNAVNEAAVTLSQVKFLLVQLLSVADKDAAGTVIGTNCSGIKIGGAANPWPFLDDPLGTISIGNGDVMPIVRRGGAGLPVTAPNENLKILNLDAAVDAKVKLSIFGCN